MAGRDRRAGWLVLGAVSGCAVFDPTQPIEIVPGDELDASEVARLEAASECWNMGFGTQLVVTRDPRSAQAVFVHYDSSVCIGASGIYTPGVPARIDVCPEGQYQGELDGIMGIVAVSYFNTVSHELGHAAGIRAEGSGDRSVMGLNMHAYEAEYYDISSFAFTEEDYALFADAHPDFPVAPMCRVRMYGAAGSGVACGCY